MPIVAKVPVCHDQIQRSAVLLPDLYMILCGCNFLSDNKTKETRMSAEGTWNTTINTPMGAQNGTLELTVDGSELNGKMSSPQGEMLALFFAGTIGGEVF